MAMKPRGLVALAAMVALTAVVSAGTVMAQQSAPVAPVLEATIAVVPVAASAADPNVITTVMPDPKSTKALVGTPGLRNVPINVPVTLVGKAKDAKATVAGFEWTLSGPSDSKATLTTLDGGIAKFTPDLSGSYKVEVVITNEAGATANASIDIHAGEFVGATAGNCAQCHPAVTGEWAKTPHATIFKDEINGGENPKLAEYGLGSEGCIRCHTTGFYPGMANGGFGEVWAKTGWQMPPREDVQASKDNWSKVPAELQNMAGIQCEDCHGPAKAHVTSFAPMDKSMDNGVCNQCHDASAKHRKGTSLKNAKHSDATSQSFTYPIGKNHQDCVRCHSGAGYVDFLKSPTTPEKWNSDMQTVGCSTCHDPHSDANAWQLRITGKPVEAAGITKDFGLSATCVECHNARTTAADAQKASFPHYSAAGDMLADQGGVTYGQTVPNSAHGMVVGNLPMANPDLGAETATLFGRAVPGSCVVCHMWPTLSDTKDPNWAKVGEHSFNTTSPDGKFQYTASCEPCHSGMKGFDLTAKADYDGNGKVEGVQEEVAGLLNTLQKAISDSGIKPVKGYPYFDQSGKANWTEKQKNAIYNYLFVRGTEEANGKANAIHNFKRSVALLQLSYKDLTGKDIAGATIMK